jgi:hypothetical protein
LTAKYKYSLHRGSSPYSVLVLSKREVSELGSSITVIEHVAEFDITKEDGTHALSTFVLGALRRGYPVEDMGGFIIQAQTLEDPDA